MSTEAATLRDAYRNFNSRNIDAVLSQMHPNVQWANGMEGGYVHGKEEVRAYWTRQFTIFNPHVEPILIESNEEGNWVVQVHQVVHDMQGNLLVDTTVFHTYQFRDDLIVRMDIRQQPAASNP